MQELSKLGTRVPLDNHELQKLLPGMLVSNQKPADVQIHLKPWNRN